MGGYGSGRSSTRPAAGLSHGLDIRLINSWGWIAPGSTYRGSYEWTRRRWGEVISRNSITVYIDEPRRCAVLAYGVNGQDISERIGMAQIRGRWFWVCPCGGRAQLLYMPAPYRYFRCRRCYPVVYQSSRDSDQRVSDTYRNLADIMYHGRYRAMDERRLIWSLKAWDRLQAQQRRHERVLIGTPEQQRERWRRRRAASYRRAARKRWANYRRREARRAARVAAYHRRRLDQPQARAIDSR